MPVNCLQDEEVWKGKSVKKRNQRGRWCPPLFPWLQRHFPIALRQTGIAAGRRTTCLPRWPVWDGNPVLLRISKSLAQKGRPSRWPLVWSCGIGWKLQTSPACSATAPASLVALGKWEETNVSRQVESHHSSREWETPVGSSLEGWKRWQGCRHCIMDNVVDSSMMLVTALTPSAAELVHGSAINLHTTVVTGVGVSKECNLGDGQLWHKTFLLSMCNSRDAPDSFIEAAKRRERDTASGACLSRGLLKQGLGCQKAGVGHSIWGLLQQGVDHGRNFGGVPGLLTVGSRIRQGGGGQVKTCWPHLSGFFNVGQLCQPEAGW